MALEKDLDLLDRYIANRLEGTEKAAFEQHLNADPELKQEYTLQQNIAAGIRQARVAQLKSMLNNIPIPAVQGGEAILAKTLAGLFVAGAIGAGVYLYMKPDNAGKQHDVEVSPLTTPEQEETANTMAGKEETQATPQAEQDAPVAQQTPAAIATEKTIAASPAAKTKDSAVASAQEPVVAKPNISVFDPSEEAGTATTKDDGSLPEISADAKASKNEIEVRTDSNNKKYTFHYQFKEGKLYLYGSFEQNLYEIMEFFSDNKRTVFLFYKSNYYLLNEESEKIKPLTPINDPVLLKKLKDYRSN